MSGENVQTVRRIYAEWEQGHMRAGVELFDAEIEFESFMPDSAERVVCRGPGGVEAFMREFLAQWKDFRLIGTEFVEAGADRVYVAGVQRAAGRRSGVTVEDAIHSVWTFRAGRVVHLLFDTDPDVALAAAGLSE